MKKIFPYSKTKTIKFEVRTKGDGEFDYFVEPTDESFDLYAHKSKKRALEHAAEVKGWVVKVSEESIYMNIKEEIEAITFVQNHPVGKKLTPTGFDKNRMTNVLRRKKYFGAANFIRNLSLPQFQNWITNIVWG